MLAHRIASHSELEGQFRLTTAGTDRTFRSFRLPMRLRFTDAKIRRGCAPKHKSRDQRNHILPTFYLSFHTSYLRSTIICTLATKLVPPIRPDLRSPSSKEHSASCLRFNKSQRPHVLPPLLLPRQRPSLDRTHVQCSRRICIALPSIGFRRPSPAMHGVEPETDAI